MTLAAEARNRYNAWSALSAEKKKEQLRDTIVAGNKDEEIIRDAALAFAQRGLQEGGSVFSEGRTVWARGPVNELRGVFVEAPDTDAGNFVGKLKIRHVEVKGSQGHVQKVILTRNEITHANEFDRRDLVVVADIEWERRLDGSIAMENGVMSLYTGWRPSPENLKQLSF